MTEQKMQQALRGFISNPKYRLENLYVFGWESDLLFLTPAGYWYEIEIKISRADFFNDFKKKAFGKLKSELLKSGKYDSPNYFYYAVPRGLVSPDEVPDYAGLLEVDFRWIATKKAPRLRGKFEPNNSYLADKFYHNWTNEKVAHMRTNIDFENFKSKYSDTDALVESEVNRAVDKERFRASQAFRKVCPHYDIDRWNCTKEERETNRCGWCYEIKKFDKIIYKEK